MENYEKHLTNLLTELVTKYVELKWDMSFCTWYINREWNYVTISEKDIWMDYSIRRTMLDSEYWTETELQWWEIIFQFNENYSYIDAEWLDDHEQDYQDLRKDKDAYIKSKVEYIIWLTY